MPVDFVIGGEIGKRWRALGGADGPFGPALGPEEDVPGRNGRRQRFEGGEIAWSPDQGMTVSVYRLRNEACFEWSRTGFDYDYFRYDISFNGVPQGQAATQLSGTTQIWVRLQGFGEYAFNVKGCHSPIVGADECPRGFTIPVRLRLDVSAETPQRVTPDVSGVIAERWHELGAWAGPLGKPIEEEIIDPARGIRSQWFERGSITTAPMFGPRMVLAAYQRGATVEVNWGGADTSFNAFRVDVLFNGSKIREELVWLFINSEWARPGIGSGQFILRDPDKDGFYGFQIHPTITSSPFPDLFVFFTSGSTPQVQVHFTRGPKDAHLDPPAIDGTHAHAFASHKSRASAVARQFARTRPLRVAFQLPTEAGENETIQLIAHLQAASKEPDFRVPGELPSRILAHVRLRQLVRGQPGTAVTEDDVPVPFFFPRKGDYDMALKGLMVIAYRYRKLLTEDELDFILRELVPVDLFGPHSQLVEVVTGENPLLPAIPETENHLLMIESTRYLVNQLLLDRTGDQRFDNVANGLRDWLVGHLQMFAKHDFLEFNARPYQRLSVHVLFNLHEFARDESVRTAAEILLDYTMMKFAVSSNRQRRITPFRRKKERTSRADNEYNEFALNEGGDQATGFFLMYAGPTDRDGKPQEWFPDACAFNAVIAGLAAYRPPPAAYIVAMTRDASVKPAQHRFYHGTRPRLPASGDVADGGIEIYYNSRSFLLTAGGMFLNSGYGHDELLGYPQTAIAQSTTLIPTRADLKFADLIRFDPYPDERHAVNTGVHQGFACGVNLRIPERWLEPTGASRQGPWYLLNLDSDLPGFGRLGFYVAAYRTPPAQPDNLVEPLDSLGIVYAMESDGMDFATFQVLTLERNFNPPARFEYGGTYVFNTADNHSFTFRFWPEGMKYAARIVQMDGESLAPDLTSLPLVEGPYLSAPGGHDGLLEVRHPGCDTPLVLDFRDPTRPTRQDNALACPKPLEDRARALMQVAEQSLIVSSLHATASLHAPAVAAAQAAVDVLHGFTPPAEQRAAFLAALADALHTLALRLIRAGRPDEAVAPAEEAVQVYRQAAAAPGADVLRVARNLTELQKQLASVGLTDEAVSAAQAAVDLLHGFTPPAEQRAAFLAALEAAEQLLASLRQD
jgi:hypothetical protein